MGALEGQSLVAGGCAHRLEIIRQARNDGGALVSFQHGDSFDDLDINRHGLAHVVVELLQDLVHGDGAVLVFLITYQSPFRMVGRAACVKWGAYGVESVSTTASPKAGGSVVACFLRRKSQL